MGLLVGLAACSTTLPAPAPAPALAPAPAQTPSPVSVLPPATALPPVPTLAGPASTSDSGLPAEAVPDERPIDPSGPALLAGEPVREYQRGGASWYGPGFHGRRTASGERFDVNALTAAHRTLPFGTLVRVHSLVNGREVEVRITDRGPFIRSRVIDLSRAAARELDMLGLGFKEVVLLVPESTPELVDEPLPVTRVRRTRRSSSRHR